MEGGFTYAETGVDTDVEALAAQMLYRYAKKTWVNRQGKLGEPNALADSFSGVRYAEIGGLPEGTVEWGNADGLGTKPELVYAAGRYDTAATDLTAMVVDDAAILGAEPAHMKTVLKVNTLGQDQSRLPFIEELARGYIAPCEEAGIAVINGELAQHNTMGSLDRFLFDWDATLTWYGHKSRLLDGSKIQTGDYLVGLREEGLRCNGISLARAILESVDENWGEMELAGQRLADVALTPSRIYTKAIVDMTGGYDLNRPARVTLHGASHITGGGIPEKLVNRLLARWGFGAVIDDPFEPPRVMTYCQQQGRVSDEEAYGAWNMGQGMILITPDHEGAIHVSNEHGIEARVIGRVTEDEQVLLHSKGLGASILRLR